MDLTVGICAVKFGAAWCGPCQMMEPLLQKMKNEFSGINYISVDIDDKPQLAKTYRIRSLPTVILLKEGQEVTRLVGAVKTEPLRKALKDLVKDQAA